MNAPARMTGPLRRPRPGARPGVSARPSALLVALLTTLLVGGCAGLPASSGVSTGRGVDERVAPEVRVIVPPPPAGAGPEEIVRGFLRAGAAFQGSGEGDEPVGNAYLVPSSVERWRPTSWVTVFDRLTIVSVRSTSGEHWLASAQAVATVDDSGRYRELPAGTEATVEFHLVTVAGEWRIDLPESGFGVWLNTDDFGRIFEPHSVHYPVVGSSRRLVADTRWLPTGPRLVTALARAQLGAVPDYLKGAVETGFPDGARLAVDAVPVRSGVATVALTAPASTADITHRRQIYAQLAATLTGLPGVTSVGVEVQGSGRLSLGEVVGPVAFPNEVGYVVDPIPPPRTGLLRTGERLERIDLAQLDDLDGPTTTAGVTPSGGEWPSLAAAYPVFAVSADGEVAAVAASGSELVRLRGRTQVPVEQFATGLVRPSYDRANRLWTAGMGASGAGVWTIDASATSRPAEAVEVPWLAGRVPVSLAVSPDGARCALVSRAANGSDQRLDVAGVVRDSSGRPTALARGWRQADPLVRITDVVWIDQTRLALLGSQAAGGALRPWIAALGQGIGLRRVGSADPALNLAPEVAGARYLVPTTGERGLVVVADTGVLLRVGGLWRRSGSGSGLAVGPVG